MRAELAEALGALLILVEEYFLSSHSLAVIESSYVVVKGVSMTKERTRGFLLHLSRHNIAYVSVVVSPPRKPQSVSANLTESRQVHCQYVGGGTAWYFRYPTKDIIFRIFIVLK